MKSMLLAAAAVIALGTASAQAAPASLEISPLQGVESSVEQAGVRFHFGFYGYPHYGYYNYYGYRPYPNYSTCPYGMWWNGYVCRY